MKTWKLLPLSLAVIACTASLRGAVLFDEDFDGEPYVSNTSFTAVGQSVTGWNKLDHGSWAVNNAAGGVVSASTAESLSPSRSMQLQSDANGDRAQAVGVFGLTGAAGTPTTQAIAVSFAFNLQNASQNTFFLVRDTGDRNLGYLTFAGGNLLANFNGVNSTVAAISNDTWYNVVMTMSADPGNGADTYSVVLYNSDFSQQIATRSGAFGVTASANSSYKYFTAYNQGYVGQTQPNISYFDNISVNTVPEPGTVGCIILGLVGVVAMRRLSRIGVRGGVTH